MNSAIVRLATVSDIGILVLHDRHVSKNILEQAVEARHVMVIEEDGGFAGWLRWSLFCLKVVINCLWNSNLEVRYGTRKTES